MAMPIFEREIERKLRKQQGLLRYSAVAERLGISQRTVYERIKAGKLKSIHYGSNRYVYVSERDLEDYIARFGGQSHE